MNKIFYGKKGYIGIFLFVFLILLGILISSNCEIKERKKKYLESICMDTSIDSEYNKLDNTKICWGLKRKEDEIQPQISPKYYEILKEYNGIAIGNSVDKNIYLTFDMGYEAGYTEKILDILKENDVKAIFFITGHYAEVNYDLVKRMIDEGHILGNHTYKHKCMYKIGVDELKEDIMKLHNLVYEKYNYEMKYLRPPKGEYSQRACAVVNSLGYKTVLWSFAYEDWVDSDNNEEKSKEKILKYIHPGEIMLLHGTSKRNMDILDSCIKEIKQKGYEFKSLDEFKE